MLYVRSAKALMHRFVRTVTARISLGRLEILSFFLILEASNWLLMNVGHYTTAKQWYTGYLNI